MIVLILLCFAPFIVSEPPSSAFKIVDPSDRRSRVRTILDAQQHFANDTIVFVANATMAPFETEEIREVEKVPAVVNTDAAVEDHIIIEIAGQPRRITHRDFIRFLFEESNRDVFVVAGLGIAFIIGCILIIELLK